LVDGDVEQSFENPTEVGELARLYLGNILYALELASLSLEEQGKGPDAGFYRGIARKLAEAHGASRAGRSEPERNA
jgi:hypothetical protein